MKAIDAIKSVAVLTLGAFLLVGSPDTSKAQSATTYGEPDPLNWGLKAGVSIGDLYGDDVGGTSAQAGFTGGLFLNYRAHPFFSIQPEILYTNKNSEVDNGIAGSGVNTEYEFNYLEIPVLFKGHIPTGGAVSPNLYVGPALSFNLSGEANDNDLDDDINGTDFGFVFGGGVDIYRNLNLDLRYTLGVVDVFDVAGDPSAKNGVFNITLGYSL